MKSVILLHGKPGSGKSSCIRRTLDEAYLPNYEGRHHLSVGSHLRSIASGESPSQFVKEVQKGSGQLGNHEPIAHEVVNAVVVEYLGTISSSALVVIDGYPKYVEQIQPFESNAQRVGANILGIMHVVVPDKVALDRMISRGIRTGEAGLSLVSARQRLAEYDSGARVATEALARIYPMEVIDGEQPMDSVIRIMRQVLESY